MEEASGRQTPASSANGGSKPATPVPPPSSPAPSGGPQPNPASSAASAAPATPGSLTTAPSHGAGRYGYPTPPPPGAPMPPHVGPYGPPPGPPGQPNAAGGYPYGGGGAGPHQMMGGPPPGHHHGQYMSPMMMPPPSQYPNKSGQPGPPPPQQQHVPFMGGGPSDGRSPAAPYGNYQGGPRMPAHHQQQHPPSHHGNAGPTPPYYGVPRHQMPPQQHPPPPMQSMGGKNAYGPYANSGGYPGQGPGQPNAAAAQHGMPPGHPGHHGPPPPPPHHPHHPSQHPAAGGGPPPPPHTNPMMGHHHAQHTPHPQPHGYGGYSSHGNSDAHHVNANSSSPMVNSGSSNNGGSSAPSTAPATSHSSNGNVRLPQPPPIMDEVSQTSTASSQAAEDSCASSDMPSHKHAGSAPSSKHHLSHPSTPNAMNLGSPGAASLSSFHDEFDSVSSPSWPRTPASPALNSSQYDSHVHNSKRPDNVQKLYEMSDEPDRKTFLDKYFHFLDERGTPLNQVPTISKVPVDLYRLYVLVKERGGYLEVTRTKMWKDCAQLCNIANSSSASYTLRKQYMKHLLPYECKFDRGGIDVGPLLSAADAASASRKKAPSSKLQANSGRSTPNTPRLSPNDLPSPATAPYHHHPHHTMQHPGYEMDPQQQQPNNYPNAAGPNQNATPGTYHPPPGPYPHPDYHNSQYGPQPNSGGGGREPHTVPNSAHGTNHESVSVKDPFADEDQVPSSPRVSKSATANYHQSRSHYSMPNHTGPYPYGQPGAPPPPPGAPNSQPTSGQPHSNNYPPEPGHYGHPDGTGQYHPQRHPPAAAAEGPTSGNNPYGSRMGVNGPSSHHHGYYGSYQQQGSYPEHASGAPPPPPPATHGRSGPYDHHGPHGYPPPPQGHRYPMPNNVGSSQHPASGAGQPTVNSYGPPPSRAPGGGYPPPSSAGGPPPPPPHHGPPPPAAASPHHGHGHGSQPGAGPPPPVSTPSSQPPTSTHHQPAPPAGAPGYPPPPPHSAAGPPTPETAAGGYGAKTPEPYNQNAANVRMQSPLAQRLLAAKLSQNSNSTTTTSTTQSPQASPQQGYPGPQYPPPSNTTGGANAPNNNSRSSPSPAPPSTQTKPPTPHSSSAGSMPATTNISWMPPNSPSVQNHHSHPPLHNNIRYAQPKRHPDFMKTNAPPESYHPNSYPPPPQHHGPQSAPYGPPNVPTSGPRSSMPPSTSPASTNAPGWAPPPAAGSNRSDSQYRMPGYYHHPGYPNSGPPPPSGQRESWHESRGTPPGAPPSSVNSSETTHWPQNRYSSNYSEYGNAQPGHYAPGHHPSAPGAGSKMMPGAAPPPPGSPYVRPEVQAASSRSNFMPGPMSHSHGYPPNKMPPPSITGSSHSIPYGPFGLHGMHHHPQGPGAMPGGHHMPMRREPLFPPNSVEATVPTLSKRRKLMARDVAPVEAWRLLMSLKSGLLAESTYALDVLNIYSNDDNSLIYLSLANMPGLLEVLLEHYRRYLNEMFDNMFEDIEIGFEDKQSVLEATKRKKRPLKWYEIDRDLEDQNELIIDEDDDDIEEFLERKFKLTGKRKLTLLDSTENFTYVSRNGKPVKVKKDKNLFILDHDKKWDPAKNGFSSGYEHWAKGGGETTAHIQSHMEPKERYIRFCRVIKTKKTSATDDGDDNSEKQEPVIKMNGDGSSPQSNGHHAEEVDEDNCKKFLNNENDYPKIHPTDRERYWKRLHQPDFEDESYDQEEPAVSTGREYQDSIKSRCLAVSNLIRNLTFVPQNDLEMSRSPCLLLILSRLVMLHHVHAIKKKRKISDLDRAKISGTRLDDVATLSSLIEEKSNDTTDTSTITSKHPEPEKEWWWEALHLIRENTMVTLANISGHLDLSTFPESITLSLFDGLLHWAVCPSSYAQDAFPSAPATLSPRRLAYEALSKLSIYECNVDLILATPPWSRIEKFLRNLTKSLVRNEDQTIREFSIVLLSNLVTADPSVVRVVATSGFALSLLLGFIEQAEQSALSVANTHGIHYLRENFDAIGTTMDMVRRAAAILLALARHHENRSLFIQHEQRLLSLSMSPILDTPISSIIADILYECSFESSSFSSSSSKQQQTTANQNPTTTSDTKRNEESNSKSAPESLPSATAAPTASSKTVTVES